MENQPLKKMMIICSKSGIENVYAALILAHGARAEGIEAEIFFTFFGLDVIRKDWMNSLHVATVGNTGMHMPTLLGAMPGMEALATAMMKKEMEKLDIPGTEEFLQMIKDEGGKVFGCKLAMDMFHLTQDDLWNGVDGTLTVGQFYERFTPDTQILFV